MEIAETARKYVLTAINSISSEQKKWKKHNLDFWIYRKKADWNVLIAHY